MLGVFVILKRYGKQFQKLVFEVVWVYINKKPGSSDPSSHSFSGNEQLRLMLFDVSNDVANSLELLSIFF